MEMRPHDLIASVTFRSPELGGPENPIDIKILRCPLEFQNEKFDCGLHLEGKTPVLPGSTVVVPITLLWPELIKPRLKVGSKFSLWRLRTLADGVVLEIVGG